MNCNNCNNPLNEWQDECEKCGAVIDRKCECHGKAVKRVKGSYMGSYDNICSIGGYYCKTKVSFINNTER
ncbi:MAG: hypothetical protein KAS32_04105 [Candidatus Peribacteraceae bacterium]|nr:hypothetical protein [Candidatus Peribacteraceae bacterium]